MSQCSGHSNQPVGWARYANSLTSDCGLLFQYFMMSKPFEERNQTDTARRKLKNLAKRSGIDVDFVTALANFTWDYDPKFGKEAAGWVSNSKLSNASKKQLHWLADNLGLSLDFKLEREQAVQALLQAYTKQSSQKLWSNFYTAAINKNYCHVSEFASYYYLRRLDAGHINALEWKTHHIGMVEVAQNLFLKMFRGGTIERHDLAYLWCDFTLPLNYEYSEQTISASWLEPLLSSIEVLPTPSKLTDLVGCCKGIISGDKFFKQEILQALSYADVIRVNDFPVLDIFMADCRDILSPHFYSNEWSFPLRFWPINGGSINREAILAHKIV